MSEIVKRLRDALAKATRGEWWVKDVGAKDPDYRIRTVSDDPIAAMAWLPGWRDGQSQANAALIVEAVNALPGLLDHIEALEARVEGYRAAVSYIGADSWDGCSDCIEILKAARTVDDGWHWSPDETARALKRLRARAALQVKP